MLPLIQWVLSLKWEQFLPSCLTWAVTQPWPNLWISSAFMELFLQAWLLRATRTSGSGSFPSWFLPAGASHWIQAQQPSTLMEQSSRKFIPWRWMAQVLLAVVADPSTQALVWISSPQLRGSPSVKALIPMESSWKTTRFPWQSPRCTPGAGAELSPRPELSSPALNCVTAVPWAKVSPAATSGLLTKLGRSQELSSPFPGKGSRSSQLIQRAFAPLGAVLATHG